VLGRARILEPPRDGRMLDSQEVKSAFEELNARNPIEAVVMDISKADDTAQWLEHELGVQATAATATPPSTTTTPSPRHLREGWLHHTGGAGSWIKVF
jgi:hypothetical protein